MNVPAPMSDLLKPDAVSLSDPWVQFPLTIIAALYVFVSVTSSNTAFFLALNSLGPAPWGDVWAHATALGDTLVAVTLLLIVGAYFPAVLWAGLIAGLCATLWTHGLKNLFDMPRPPAVLPAELVHVIGPVLKKHSYPSGHTTTAFALAAVLCLHVRAVSTRAVLIALACAVGVSRAVVGVHWPLDILAGAFGGWLSGCAGTLLAQRWPQGLGRAPQLVIGALLGACALAVLLRADPIYTQTQYFQWAVAVAGLAAGAFGFWKRYRPK